MLPTLVPVLGLSPRGRGKRVPPSVNSPISGSIPAWAGETGVALAVNAIVGVYPRVGGGNAPSPGNPNPAAGLSPRGRGKHYEAQSICGFCRSIPAWAGETRPPAAARLLTAVYPRVGGGNATSSDSVGVPAGLSPRGRGKRLSIYPVYRNRRSIPAWAGETISGAYRPTPRRVYPRVGGGNPAYHRAP